MIIPLVDAIIVPIGLPASSFSPVDIVPTCTVRNLRKKKLSKLVSLSLKDITSSVFPLPLPFITAANIISAESILDGLNLRVGFQESIGLTVQLNLMQMENSGKSVVSEFFTHLR